MTPSNQDRYRGALLGLACGDALGTTVEFQPRGTFAPLTDMVGGGPFGLKAGEWTDDTSMALCLAQSLIANKGMNLEDQLERYLGWWKHGDNSVTGHCFDIGNTVRRALENYSLTNHPYSGSLDPMSAGNGSIMRLAPVPLFFATGQDEELMEKCELSSVTTHQAPESLHACRLLGLLIRNALQATEKEAIFQVGRWFDQSPRKIQAIVRRDYRNKSSDEIQGTGYVIHSLEAALWAFETTSTFEKGALKAVNLGDDADTTGAIYGQVAGAFYGESNIPKSWLRKLAWRKRITRLADQICETNLLS
jgi:ADP-ribosyl-[dinitrogen reductase] hydrolase